MPVNLPRNLPRWTWALLAGVLVVLALFWGVSCYGKSRYDEGRRGAEVAHTDSVRKAMTRSIDSVHNAMSPVLETLREENEKLKDVARKTRLDAAAATGRATRAEAILRELPDSIMSVTPPQVVALIDSLTASSQDMRESIKRLAEQTVEIQMRTDSALAEAEKWKKLQEATRQTLDTAQKQIRQLVALKDPPKCGFKCGFIAGGLTAAGVVITIVSLTR